MIDCHFNADQEQQDGVFHLEVQRSNDDYLAMRQKKKSLLD